MLDDEVTEALWGLAVELEAADVLNRPTFELTWSKTGRNQLRVENVVGKFSDRNDTSVTISISEGFIVVNFGDCVPGSFGGDEWRFDNCAEFELSNPTSIDKSLVIIVNGLRLSRATWSARVTAGWSLDEILSTPLKAKRQSLGLVPSGPIR